MKRTLLGLSFVLTLLTCSTLRAQLSPFFPRTGDRAVAQLVREIRNPRVFLIIAAAPGLEDLPSIAYLRVGTGAKVAVAFITNGEDIPSDLNGETFYLLASRRKEEAYRALSYLGVESYFLNVPSNEFPVAENSFHPSARLNEVFTARLDTIIDDAKPDVIILDESPLSGMGVSKSFEQIGYLVNKDIETRSSLKLWEVDRFLAETSATRNAVSIFVGKRDQIWSRSYAVMAEEAQECYKSLRYQIPLWRNLESHRYVQVYPNASALGSRRNRARSWRQPLSYSLLSGTAPLKMGKRLTELLPVIDRAGFVQRFRTRKGKLDMLHDTIARADILISRYAGSMDHNDQRILATWKLDLEKLRCAVLGINIHYSVSDTVVTPIQLFFLSLSNLNRAYEDGRTQIIFPGVVRKQWIVNETHDEFYNWKESGKLRVLTPRSIALNSPEIPGGFMALQVRTPFTFMVVHKDSDPEYDFFWREDIPLIISPYRSIQVLTPHIAMRHDADIVVRFRSNVRDRSGGEFYVDDSLVSSPRGQVELPGKNSVVTDTLPLGWKESTLPTPRSVQILASGNIDIGSFAVHPFDVKVKASGKVGLYSTIEDSPLRIMLSRLGVETVEFDVSGTLPQDLADYSTVVLDQFSLRKFSESSVRLKRLRRWVAAGGHLLVMAQYGMNMRSLLPNEEAAFSYLPVHPALEQVVLDSGASVFNFPNQFANSDFGMGAFPISFGSIKGLSRNSSHVLMTSASGDPLLVEQAVGDGKVIFCALNLYPEFLSVDPSACKLIANLLSH